MRIAMWSGPRNLSTAMMYAFAARSDTHVWDEPFYAAYLRATGLDHPMRDAVIAAGEPSYAAAIQGCLGPVPGGKAVFYQKHMAQHMIADVDQSWMRKCTNIFLIRDPSRVIASYAAKRENPMLDDIGFCQQAELFDTVAQYLGKPPPVLDSVDIRANPEAALRKLCVAINLPFQPAMLSWPQGGHAQDGVWGQHWYGAVRRSTGFADPEGPLPEVPENLRGVRDAAEGYYRQLWQYRL
jgi:sulfotransferase family protein